MEELGLAQFDTMGSAVRKKRSQISRRPKDSQTFTDNHDHSSLSISPPSDDMSKASSDENADNSRRKEFGLNQSVSKVSLATTGAESKKAFSGSNSGRSVINNRSSHEGALAPLNWRSTSKLKECMNEESRTANMYCGRNGESLSSEQSGVSSDILGNEGKFKKVKFKVGDVAHTINANSTTNGRSSTKNPRFSDTSSTRQKLSLQGNLEEEHFASGKRPGLQGVPWKEFSRRGFSLGKEDCLMGKTSGKNTAGKQGNKSEAARKSKRAPKRRVLDGGFGEDDDDGEIRYLEKLKLKVPTRLKEDDGNDGDESIKKQRKLSTLGSSGALRLVKDGKKISRSDQAPEDEDYEEEEPLSDGEFVGSKKQKKESVESLTDGKREMTLTKRQRALQSSKDGSSVTDANLIEFPNGLPPAPSKKQKETLTEVEQQSKKAEAAQRRRLQVEKAARESEAEAIRKILGQDSSRKKREDKMKKRMEELAQEKATTAQLHASNTIRWVMGPTGTVVTFPREMGLPSIFDSKPCSYPPPREKCAGPSCTNPYKYRDTKSKLPLCSLQCYKAIRQQSHPETN
ncbi:INO80 COMPLEX SUBUNIT B [Salix koriyanagi]|uniref:INO80 COMPLEX SUBUNIT B n=1 Tax=Salix koriyanagi TaxID=2511006 RepID=A0A9Q0U4J1_9ROSI|nr:INO80 COMPLEX SUBUNIT B [Salix koriyanagi]